MFSVCDRHRDTERDRERHSHEVEWVAQSLKEAGVLIVY